MAAAVHVVGAARWISEDNVQTDAVRMQMFATIFTQ